MRRCKNFGAKWCKLKPVCENIRFRAFGGGSEHGSTCRFIHMNDCKKRGYNWCRYRA